MCYLETPGLHVSSQGELLVVRLRQIHRAEGTEHLADDVVTGVPVEAEHHEVQGCALEHPQAIMSLYLIYYLTTTEQNTALRSHNLKSVVVVQLQ